MATAKTPLQREYQQWTDNLPNEKDPRYYHNLLKFSQLIIDDLTRYKQHFIARKLRMTGPKFSIIKQVLEAQDDLLRGE